MTEFTVCIVDWADRENEIASVRRAVFVQEQGVSEDEEYDGLDPQCRHVLACDEQGRPIGTGRLDKEGKIGRMAVLKPYRRRGVGKAMIEALIEHGADCGMEQFQVAAQVRARAFYEAMGFETYGDHFEEIGIPHVRMILRRADIERSSDDS